MENRAYSRISVSLDAQICCGSRSHKGTVMNISEKGMFISTEELYFPFDSQLEVVLPFREKELRVPVSLRRMEMYPDSHDGIGVEFTGISEEYLQFVDNLRSSV